MTTLSDYGVAFREAYAALHGGQPGEAEDAPQRRAGESLEEYLARSRGQALGRIRRRLSAVEAPEGLRKSHDILLRLLEKAAEADEALAAQVKAYGCGQFQESVAHSDRLQSLVAESARLDRELILSLKAAEEAVPGTLSHLGISLD